MLNLLFDHFPAVMAALAVVALVGLFVSTIVITEDQSGLVIKRYGNELPPGRQIAIHGEAGVQATLLSPGWHLGYWPWKFKVRKVPLVEVPAGQIALVMANDGAPIPSERVLARDVDSDNFQDAVAFLRAGGEKGRQLAILTAGRYRINPALFDVVTARRAHVYGLSATQLSVFNVPSDKVGIVTCLDGAPIAAGNMA